MPRFAYVDTSCLVAVAFGEPGSVELAQRLEGYERLLSSNLLEAEFRATLTREGVTDGEELLSAVTWIFPDRRLTGEIGRVTAHGYVRGADLWHLACALYLAGEALTELAFETLDRRQELVATHLGFSTSLEAPTTEAPEVPGPEDLEALEKSGISEVPETPEDGVAGRRPRAKRS